MTSTTFLERLGVRLPIVQAPMAGVSTPQLAAAVTNANGLGSLGIAAMTPSQADEAIKSTQKLTSGPFNVNVFCHEAPRLDSEIATLWLQYLAPHFATFGEPAPKQLDLLYKSFDEQDEVFQLLLDTRPAVVSFHFGLPKTSRLRQLRSVGIRLIGTATNLAEAEALASAGLDAIVAQGIEAGGHRGVFDTTARDEKLTTLALTQLLIQRVSIPIISAGGIMNGSAIAAMQSIGAEAAQLGTAFISSPESSADSAYRAALLIGDKTGTVLTTAISGRPARGLRNRFTALGEHPSCPPIPQYPLSYSVGKRLNAAATACGSAEYGAHWAGQGVALLRPMQASTLVEVLAKEWLEARKTSDPRSTGR